MFGCRREGRDNGIWRALQLSVGGELEYWQRVINGRPNSALGTGRPPGPS